LGGAEALEIAHYDLKKRQYFNRHFRGTFEILSLVGNISRRGKEVIVHVHGAFGRTNFSVLGGHIGRCIIGGTAEIYLNRCQPLYRERDSKTGLNLLV